MAESICLGLPSDQPPTEVRKLVEHELTGRPDSSLNGQSINYWVEKLTPRIERALLSIHAAAVKAKVTPMAEIMSSSDYYIRGPHWISNKDDAATARFKRRHRHLHRYRESVRNLDDQQFEKLCSRILTSLGATEAKVTRRSADDGVDFYSTFPFGVRLKYSGPIDGARVFRAPITVIGQAKHYDKARLSPSDIRDFVGAIVGWQQGVSAYPAAPPLADISKTTYAPFICVIACSGWVSDAAIELCLGHGISVLDINTISLLLSELQLCHKGRSKFDSAGLIQFLNL